MTIEKYLEQKLNVAKANYHLSLEQRKLRELRDNLPELDKGVADSIDYSTSIRFKYSKEAVDVDVQFEIDKILIDIIKENDGKEIKIGIFSKSKNGIEIIYKKNPFYFIDFYIKEPKKGEKS
jgi:hypothetical protein